MKNIKILFYALIIISIFSACVGDETNQDCFTCDNTATTYCIDQGDDFYVAIPANGTATSIPLNGEFWSDVRANLEIECTNGPQIDCYTCQDTNTTSCYLPGDTFYTTTANGSSTETELNGESWTNIKVDLESDCADDPNQDCYTCTSEATTYCFVDGDTFYTTTINGNSTETELNGETWENIRAALESNCPTGQTASIVGNWKINDFHGTSEATTTIAGQTTTIESVQTATTHEAFVEFTENPDEYNGSGFITIDSVTAGQTTTYTTEPFDNGTWEINGSQIILDGDTENAGTITELSSTTLTIDFHQTSTSTTSGITTNVVLDFTQSYTRQ